jgi:hypothetical protein
MNARPTLDAARITLLRPRHGAAVTHSVLCWAFRRNICPLAAERIQWLLASSRARPFLGHRIIRNGSRANVTAGDIHFTGRAHNRQIRADPVRRLYGPRPMRMQRFLQLALAEREFAAKAEAPLRGKRFAPARLSIRAGVGT